MESNGFHHYLLLKCHFLSWHLWKTRTRTEEEEHRTEVCEQEEKESPKTSSSKICFPPCFNLTGDDPYQVGHCGWKQLLKRLYVGGHFLGMLCFL